MRRLAVSGDETLDRLAVEHREYLDVALGVLIAHVEPELVELVRRCIARIKPDVARLGLAELRAVGLLDQRARQRESLAARLAADQLGPGRDVAPLVGPAHLELAVLMLV